MAEPGTLEQFALIVGEALEPLADDLQPDRATLLLARLGLDLPPQLVSQQLRSALGAGAAAAGELPALLGDLVATIDADAGGIQIGAKAAPLVAKVATIIDSFGTVANAIRSLAVPGVTDAQLDSFAAGLPGRLLDYLVVANIELRQPTLAALLGLVGIIDVEKVNAGSTDPSLPEVDRKRLRLDRLGDFLDDPEALARGLYAWGENAFDAALLLERFGELLEGVGIPIGHGMTDGPSPRPSLDIFLAQIAGTPAGVSPPGLDLNVRLALGDSFSLAYPIASGLELEVRAKGSTAASAGIRVQPPASLTVRPPTGSAQGGVAASLARVPESGGDRVVLFGVAGATSLSVTRMSLGLTTSFAWDAGAGEGKGDVGIEGRLDGGKLVISLAEADGFIGSIMGGFGLEAEFDLAFGWTAGGGVHFTGSGGLEVQVPTHIELGPVEIMALTVQIGIAPPAFPIKLAANIKGALGPIQAVVEEIGLDSTVSFPGDGSGNVGPVDLAFGFKSPKGVGLSLDVGIVKGGGYLSIDEARGEYAGALEFVFADFLSVNAVGLITTKNPDGSPGFSLLIVLTAEFPGGIQLGFGFTLLGVGGLLGLNRTMNLQALMEGVRTGAIESVMFPQDVVANAPRIISDLRTFFPAEQGTFLIGPMVKLGWGTPTLISVSVGVIIEIPGNIAIVGVLKVVIPTEEAALIKLQVNFAGAIEFDKKRLYFFAALFESRILFMTLEGEMGLLVAWGGDASFVLSVGGFHPRFSPPPLPFPNPRRIVVSILDTDWARIRVTNYFAVTSNTVQFGASAELYFGFSAISVEGHIAFDALFQFSPFYFIVEVSASVSLKVFGMGVFSIRLRFSLEGTSPWRAKGSGSISFFFFEVSADFDITWGDPKDTELEPADVIPVLQAALSHASAWQARRPPGTNLLVTLRSLESGSGDDDLVLHPLGTLEVRERAVPLDLTIAKVGSKKAADANRFTLATASTAFSKRGDVDEQFAMAQFLDLDDADKLSRPSFERQHGGIELSAAGTAPGTARMVRRVVRYEEIIIDNQFRRRARRFRPLPDVLFAHFINGASVTLSVLSQAQQQLKDPFGDAIAVQASSYVVAANTDNSVLAGTTTFTSHAAAVDHLNHIAALDPNLAAAAHVIPSWEAVGVPA